MSSRRHPTHPVSALILYPTEIEALWSQNYDTGSDVVLGRQRSVQCHAIYNIHTWYASYPDTLREKRQKNTKMLKYSLNEDEINESNNNETKKEKEVYKETEQGQRSK